MEYNDWIERLEAQVTQRTGPVAGEPETQDAFVVWRTMAQELELKEKLLLAVNRDLLNALVARSEAEASLARARRGKRMSMLCEVFDTAQEWHSECEQKAAGLSRAVAEMRGQTSRAFGAVARQILRGTCEFDFVMPKLSPSLLMAERAERAVLEEKLENRGALAVAMRRGGKAALLQLKADTMLSHAVPESRMVKISY